MSKKKRKLREMTIGKKERRGTERGWKGRGEGKNRKRRFEKTEEEEREIREGGRSRQRVLNLPTVSSLVLGTTPKTTTRCSKYCREGFLGVELWRIVCLNTCEIRHYKSPMG